MAKYEKTYCSQCGHEFGPGNHGYSHCSDHIREQVLASDEYSPAVKRVSKDFFDALDRRQQHPPHVRTPE